MSKTSSVCSVQPAQIPCRRLGMVTALCSTIPAMLWPNMTKVGCSPLGSAHLTRCSYLSQTEQVKKKCHSSCKLLGSRLAAWESVQACRLLLTWAAEISHSSSFGFQNLTHSADFIFPAGFFEPDSFHLHSIATAELKHRKGLSRQQLFLLINVHCVRIGMRLLCSLCPERRRMQCVLCSPLLAAFSCAGKGTQFPFLQMPLNVSVFSELGSISSRIYTSWSVGQYLQLRHLPAGSNLEGESGDPATDSHNFYAGVSCVGQIEDNLLLSIHVEKRHLGQCSPSSGS